MKKTNSSSLQSMTLGFLIMLAIAAGAGFAVGKYKYKYKQPAIVESEPSILLVLRGTAVVDGNAIAITDPQIEWFSDRPQRHAGTISVDKFLSSWNQSDFSADPPNAAFSEGGNVVELLNATVADDILTFEYVDISGALQEGKMGEVSLFIDAFPTAVNSQITD